MRFLVADDRSSPVALVFVEQDPRADPGFPAELLVRLVELIDPPGERENLAEGGGAGSATRVRVGRSPAHPGVYRTFRSARGVTEAGFSPIRLAYVVATWEEYTRGGRRVAAAPPGGPTPRPAQPG